MKDINKRLRDAAKDGDEAKLKVLLRDPSCNALNADATGMTALMWAARMCHEACVEILLPASDTLGKSKGGMTALMSAACGGNEECVKLLLPASNACAADEDGWTALMRAAYYGHEACVMLLIPASDPCAKGKSGLTASDLARSRSHVSLGQFIDAYILAQSERTDLEVAAPTVALRGGAVRRV